MADAGAWLLVLEALSMGTLASAVLVVLVIAVAVVLLIAWDRLVGTALVGVSAGAVWAVAQSKGRWWFWPIVWSPCSW